jgi:putative intracellular protease/amidase
MNSQKALIVVTSHDQLGNTGKKTGWYLPEVTHVYYPLVEAGFAVDFASPEAWDAVRVIHARIAEFERAGLVKLDVERERRKR